MRWELRLRAAERGVFKAVEMRRLLAKAGLEISAGKMSALWSATVSVRLDDVEVLCRVLGCDAAGLLVLDAPADRFGQSAGPGRPRGRAGTWAGGPAAGPWGAGLGERVVGGGVVRPSLPPVKAARPLEGRDEPGSVARRCAVSRSSPATASTPCATRREAPACPTPPLWQAAGCSCPSPTPATGNAAPGHAGGPAAPGTRPGVRGPFTGLCAGQRARVISTGGFVHANGQQMFTTSGGVTARRRFERGVSRLP
ncbi:helix-turn-helix domain-containing protein [Streptomyces sp. NBC_00199]|nr:helix-turn-helix domain-containing protein [Streptomyces sp. NBC_00199]